MPLNIPLFDYRKYQELLKEALARISMHNPTWTSCNESDPGITLIELLAFLAETLLYRANQVPVRNRRNILSLLNIPLRPSSPARGLVTISNDSGSLQTVTLNDDLEVCTSQVPFRTDKELDVLPIEAQVYFKRRLNKTTGGLPEERAQRLQYETVQFSQTLMDAGGVDLGTDTFDDALWVALLVRTSDEPGKINMVRRVIAGKTLSLGIVPVLSAATQQLAPFGQNSPAPHLQYAIPHVSPKGKLPANRKFRVPRYQPLTANASVDVLSQPGVVEITLPPHAEMLTLWGDLDPSEAGTGDFPPILADTNLSARLITWLRIGVSSSYPIKLLWLGINTVSVTQRMYIHNELLPRGTGEPDQCVTLARSPVLADSVLLTVTTPDGQTEQWDLVDDLLAAGPEESISASLLPPGMPVSSAIASKVFQLDAESGVIRFGDGIHGARPPFQAILCVNYAYSLGPGGNVGPGSINSSPVLPAGFAVSNPLRTWGGTAGESMSEAEHYIARYLHHRDRLISISDFETIAMRTPGLDVGRVEVIPGYNPTLSPFAPRDASSAVTLMVIPRYDRDHSHVPVPDRLFLDTIAAYLEPRRSVTTEIFLRGPIYKPIRVAVSLKVIPEANKDRVCEDVKAVLVRYLSPLPLSPETLSASQMEQLAIPQFAHTRRGWPLRKTVIDLELQAVVSRVEGVQLVTSVLLTDDLNPSARQIPMHSLELPHLIGVNITIDEPLSLDQIREQAGASEELETSMPIVPDPLTPIPALLEEPQ